MASYVVPQVEIHQIFSELPVALATNQVPFVFGPNYLLHRYEDEAEKATVYLGKYTSETPTGFFGTLPGMLDQDKVDTSSGYTKVFGDNVIVKLFTENSVTKDTTDSSKLVVTTTLKKQAEMYVGRYLRVYDGESSSDAFEDVKIIGIDSKKSDNTKICLVVDMDIPYTSIDSVDVCEIQDGVEFTSEDTHDAAVFSNYYWKLEKDTESSSESYNELGIAIKGTFYAKIVDSDYSGDSAYGQVYSADLYVTYRELITAASDTLHSLTDATEVASALGTISPDNPLAQSVYNAALNAGGQTIRYMAVPTDDLNGYSTVLNAATLTKEVYFLVPATRNDDVLKLVKAHVNSMSAATTKRWRIAFISAEIPEEDPIYTAASNTDGSEFYAKSLGNKKVQFVVKNGNTWVEDPNTKFRKYVKVNDVLNFNFTTKWGKSVPTQYLVTKVVNDNTIMINENLAATTGDATKAEIIHPYTNAEKAEVIRDLSSSFADRRLYNVFPSVFTGSGVLQTGEFAAACVAGLVSSCLPQQPVTNLELTGIDDVPLVYQTFSYDQLNTMASGGTFIVMQDLPGDQVYIRHQISTQYEDNNLNTAELSVTKNLDSISYFFDDLLSPYIGKYNITPELLSAIGNVINEGIVSLSSNSYGLYGSQIIADETEVLLLEQDALLKDHINCNLKLNLPYPFNHIVLKLFV